MDTDMEDTFCMWLRENLVIEVANEAPSGPWNSVYISLRLRGEKTAFTQAHVYIPAEAEAP